MAQVTAVVTIELELADVTTAKQPSPFQPKMSKRRRSASPSERLGPDVPQSSLRSTLHVQAYEATIIRSQPDAAARVTMRERDGQPGGLIRWTPDGLDDAEEVWVDRYVLPA